MNYFGGGGGLPPPNGGNNNNGGWPGSNGGGGGNGKPPLVKPDPPDERGQQCKLTSSEEGALKVIYAEDEISLDEQMEAAHRKLWLYFQAAAASLTQLYRNGESLRNLSTSSTSSSGRSSRGPPPGLHGPSGTLRDDQLWGPFQTAAGNLTTLYRESWDGLLRPAVTSSKRSGYTRARKELATWARSQRRRVIRREELLNVLAGMTYQPPAPDLRSQGAAAAAAAGGLGGARGGGGVPEPLLGVEELLQAATVADPETLFRPISAAAGVKRTHATSSSSPSSSTVVSRTPSPPKSPPDQQNDVNMADLFAGPVVKKPRQS